ncbi:hypothetical protein [Pantoea cypripedii]|uniref:Uncharacterized protein n=1 Tax=Pantoea cypripedii TaxID=55209 RepID=A0A1X1ERJ6_PANCY|nr:hypothetical protein [Pantoea cypripedii]MBP2196651.1 hypothetical protein [Pantoea cypripedii]ORM92628.1 hypothetical protein HA50_04350 [Pantoea cypripedii]
MPDNTEFSVSWRYSSLLTMLNNLLALSQEKTDKDVMNAIKNPLRQGVMALYSWGNFTQCERITINEIPT